MKAERKQVGWGFFLWWVLASALGQALGVGVLLSVVLVVREAIRGYGVVLLALNGVMIGILQWFVLRQHVSRAGWWVLATALGWLMGAKSEYGLGVALIGIMMGILQWFVLRQHVSRAGWWVLASAMGVAARVVVINVTAVDIGSFMSLMGLVAGVAVEGAITGGFLVWLLRQSARQV